MTQSLGKVIIVGIANTISWLFWTTFLTALYLGITDPDILFGNFYSDKPYNLSKRLSAEWQKILLVCVFVFLVVSAWGSKKAQAIIREINIGGSWLIPLLISLHIAIVVGYIILKEISYPSTAADEDVISVYFLSAAGIIYLPFLVSLNQALKEPATSVFFITTGVALYVPAYIGLLVWVHYIFSGEIEPMLVLKRFLVS